MRTARKTPMLTGMVATLALAAAGWAQAQPGPGPMGGPMMDGPMMGGPMMGGPGADMPHGGRHMMPGAGPGAQMHDRLLDRVGASAEQKTRIRDIYRAAHADIAKTHEAQRDLHRQMATLMSAPQIDAAAAEALRQKITAGHDAVSKRMLQARLDASAVLTPEQRRKLSEYLAQRREMRERHWRERQHLDTPRG